MRSITAYTEEIDDLNEAVSEILGQIDDFRLDKNSLAVVFAEVDADYSELYSMLSEKWDFPIIGCTTMAMFTGKEGYCPMGISVMILTADDCEFAVGITNELYKDNYEEEISRVYNELKGRLSSEPKLLLSYAGMVTDEEHVPGDGLVEALDKVGGGIPVYGAAASDGFSFTEFRAYCNDRITRDGLVLAIVSGNIDPKVVCVNSIENKASFLYEITESDSNLIYRLGNNTFVDVLKKEGMEADKTEVLGDYILSPFMVTVDKDGDKVEVARNLSMLNHETGAGAFLGVMPEGAILSIGLLNRSDVQDSVENAFGKMLKMLSDEGDRYHTLICTSCVARFLALASHTSAEAETYRDRLPEDMSLIGLYAYGEYCPVEGADTGKRFNMFHNFTFTILAI